MRPRKLTSPAPSCRHSSCRSPRTSISSASCWAASPRHCAPNWRARAPVPAVPPEVSIGLPAELARRRPDIREAEANLHAATAQIGVAVADLFPRLTLPPAAAFSPRRRDSCSSGPAALGRWVPRSICRSSIADAGRRCSCMTCARRRPRSLISAPFSMPCTRSTMRSPLTRPDQQRRDWLDATVAQNRDALALSRQRYESGVISFIDVLDVERTFSRTSSPSPTARPASPPISCGCTERWVADGRGIRTGSTCVKASGSLHEPTVTYRRAGDDGHLVLETGQLSSHAMHLSRVAQRRHRSPPHTLARSARVCVLGWPLRYA